MREEQSTTSASYIMLPKSIEAFLTAQRENGASKDSLRQRKGFVTYLFHWLSEDKELSRERLERWREDMEQREYTQQTILNYVKGINLYLDYMGWSEIRFNRGRIHIQKATERILDEIPQVFLEGRDLKKGLCV